MAAKEYTPRAAGDSAKALASKYGSRAIWIVWILLAVAVLSTTVDYVKPGQVAVIMNNLTRTATLKTTDGVVVHMPLGITRVYTIDRLEQTIRMTGEEGVGDRHEVDNVRLKTSEGANVSVDVELAYRVDPSAARTVIETFGQGDTYKLGFVRSYARSKVRDTLGQLTLEQIGETKFRQEKAEGARLLLNDELTSLGLLVSSLSITGIKYNEEYDALITKRTTLEEEITNQQSARETATSEQKARIEEAERLTSTTLTRVKGEQNKRIIEAQGEAAKMIKEADASAYKLTKEGDETYAAALSEARALEQEGLKKAEGIQKLAEAYRKGGLALVREQLAKKYMGKRISGKPYTLDSRIDRLRVEHEDAAAVARPKGGK